MPSLKDLQTPIITVQGTPGNTTDTQTKERLDELVKELGELFMAQLLFNEEMAAQLKRLQYQIEVQPLIDRITTLEEKPPVDLSPLATKQALQTAITQQANTIATNKAEIATEIDAIQLTLDNQADVLATAQQSLNDRINLKADKSAFDGLTARMNTLFSWENNTEYDTGSKLGTKAIYSRCYSGTTPNNSSDNTVFTIAGATQVLHYEGYYKESNANRYNAISGAFSGNNAHGQMFKFYITASGGEMHFYNATGDTRHQNCPYLVRVLYVK